MVVSDQVSVRLPLIMYRNMELSGKLQQHCRSFSHILCLNFTLCEVKEVSLGRLRGQFNADVFKFRGQIEGAGDFTTFVVRTDSAFWDVSTKSFTEIWRTLQNFELLSSTDEQGIFHRRLQRGSQLLPGSLKFHYLPRFQAKILRVTFGDNETSSIAEIEAYEYGEFVNPSLICLNYL